MARTPIIGLAGRKQSGKDTFASVLVEEYGFARVAFSDPIKEMLYELSPLVDAEMDGAPWPLKDLIDRYGWDYAKEAFPEVRRLMQVFGTDVIRKRDDEFWIKVARDIIREHVSAGTPVVVTDVRFPNEVEMVRREHGVVLRIYRPNQDTTDDASAHASETSLDDLPLTTILNDGSIEDLKQKARAIAELVGGPVAAPGGQLVGSSMKL